MRAAYSSQELAKALGLSQVNSPDGGRVWPEPTDEQLLPFIDQAHAEAEAYLGARYELPLPVLPASLKPVLMDIARYRMAGSERTSEQVQLRYEQSTRFLKMVARGEVSLGIETHGVEQPKARPVVMSTPDERVLSRSKWKDY